MQWWSTTTLKAIEMYLRGKRHTRQPRRRQPTHRQAQATEKDLSQWWDLLNFCRLMKSGFVLTASIDHRVKVTRQFHIKFGTYRSHLMMESTCAIFDFI